MNNLRERKRLKGLENEIGVVSLKGFGNDFEVN